MRIGPRSLALVAWACGFLLAAPVHGEGPAIAAKPFTAIAAPKPTLAGWRTQLCALPELACASDPDRLTLYRAAGDPTSTAWGILETGPALLKLRALSTGGWAIERKWDFSGYNHSASNLASDAPASTSVYPALYPVGPGTWAVAVIVGTSQMFAGGGAGYSSADFVVLGDGDPTAAVYANVPFSCSKDLKGCFTEEEYRRSPNCRDAYDGFLTIVYRPSKSHARYAWTLTWHESHQAPGVPKSRTEVTQKTVDLPLEKVEASKATSSFSFCGGGISGAPEGEGDAH